MKIKIKECPPAESLRAAIDLGTQTCLLLIARWDDEKTCVKEVLLQESQMLRLGEGVDQNRRLKEGAMHRSLLCLKDYVEKCRSFGITPEQVRCAATSQARDAANTELFFETIARQTGFKFRTLSGIEEARLTFQGVLLPEMDAQNTWVLDIGGGSTELISLSQARSIDLGSLRLTERFFLHDPVLDSEFEAAMAWVDTSIESWQSVKPLLEKGSKLYAVAGAATSLAAWSLGLEVFDAKKVDQVLLSQDAIKEKLETLKNLTTKERSAIPCIGPKRGDIILAGTLILWRVLYVLGLPSVQISSRGLRFGLLVGAR